MIKPRLDTLLERVDSHYACVLIAAKRARQINAYYSQLNEGLLEYVGPLVETHVQEKPLSVALREIDAGLLSVEPVHPGEEDKLSLTSTEPLDGVDPADLANGL